MKMDARAICTECDRTVAGGFGYTEEELSSEIVEWVQRGLEVRIRLRCKQIILEKHDPNCSRAGDL